MFLLEFVDIAIIKSINRIPHAKKTPSKKKAVERLVTTPTLETSEFNMQTLRRMERRKTWVPSPNSETVEARDHPGYLPRENSKVQIWRTG